MNTPEHVFALFVEANPVADPGRLDIADERGGMTMHIVEPDELTEERRPIEGRRGGLTLRRGWKPAAVAAAAVLLVGAIGLGALLFTTMSEGPVAAESADMEVVFDGSSCAYRGPTELLAGEGLVAFERTQDAEPVALVVTRVREGEGPADIAAAEEWSANRSAQEVPPWLESADVEPLTGEATSLQMPVTFEAARYIVTCITSPEGTDRVHVGTILTVTSG